jgi:hypothetical protein
VKPLLAAFVLAAVTLAGQPVRAHDAYSDAESHPLKIASYPVAVAGFIIEWLVTRPVHFLASQPPLQRPLNYEPTYNAFDVPDPYLPSRGPGGRYLPQDAQVLTPPAGSQEIVPRD